MLAVTPRRAPEEVNAEAKAGATPPPGAVSRLSSDPARVRQTLLRCFDPSVLEIVGMVGVGTSAIVVKAKMQGHGLVAVKCIPTTESFEERGGRRRQGAGDDEVSLRLPFEILLHSLLEHERIPRFVGVCMKKTEFLFIQQLVTSSDAASETPSDLWSLLYAGKVKLPGEQPPGSVLTPAHIARICLDLLSALEYIHFQRICHCDITPKNILIDQSRRAFLTDFGCARVLHPPAGDNMAAGSPSRLKGCTKYLAPEVMRDLNAFSPKSDMYSFGVVMGELLVGEAPWQDVPECEIEYQVQVKRASALHHYGQKVRDAAAAAAPRFPFSLVERLLSFEAANRPSAAEVKTLLLQQYDTFTIS
uniref:Protein kinase domain-containing protein n=1 Tax=Phaeocystis cordata TaxID=118079 RepID=A0A7S1MZX5_9EUKA